MLTDNITRDESGALLFAGQSVNALADRYGTPLYLMDEDRIRQNCRMYLEAFRDYFGEGSRPLYAGKAASFRQMYRIMAEEGMGIDAVSPGEIATALSAGFPAENIYYHGDGKTDADIAFALDKGVGCFIVDNGDELISLNEAAEARGIRQKVLLRITPGIDPHTYAAINTGAVDVKFGVPIETGQAMEFVRAAMTMENLDVAGLHCHVGSMVFFENVYLRTVDLMVGFMAEVRDELDITFRELNLGGGYGVRYTDDDPHSDIPARLREVAARLKEKLSAADLPLPNFLMEPGRSIVADAGMTVYTVCSVKRIPGYKSYVITDGGMTDNPRYCLYGAEYTVLHTEKRRGLRAIYDLAGRCCESGDIIQPAISLPVGTHRGDRVAVCTTGAYNYSMASNYNRFPRPPVVMLRRGESFLAVRRETVEDVCALDI
ncbi:MAG: diaminopimelate decarboxylase [Oscillospiraceae bacterium]|nr:diaminopimelate decarboxylase [Oscillospiraceae bacterium]MBR6208151.1 diaminopimelate decarboxylase [Oscillospiraceae bacterium]